MNDLLNEMIEKDIKVVNNFFNPEVTELYNRVFNYIRNNHLCEENEDGVYYIKQNGVGFELIRDYAPEEIIMIKKVDSEILDDYIDITYVYNNIISVKQAKIRNEINEINKRIELLNQMGVGKKKLQRLIRF